MPEENNPATETIEDASAAPVEVAEHVEEATTGATEIASSTGEDGWKVVAEELSGLRGDITKLMKSTTKAAQTAAAPATTPSAAPAPDVEVKVSKPPERRVRRGHRKVSRHG
jgi:methyl-accepting chemotaxis protein